MAAEGRGSSDEGFSLLAPSCKGAVACQSALVTAGRWQAQAPPFAHLRAGLASCEPGCLKVRRRERAISGCKESCLVQVARQGSLDKSMAAAANTQASTALSCGLLDNTFAPGEMCDPSNGAGWNNVGSALLCCPPGSPRVPNQQPDPGRWLPAIAARARGKLASWAEVGNM